MPLPLDVDAPSLQRTLTWPREVQYGPSAIRRSPAVNLLGIDIDAISNAEALDQIERWIAARNRPHLVMTPDTTALMHAQSVAELRRAYRQADLVTADGTGLVWASRQLGRPLPERVTGIDLLNALCQRSAERRDRVFLLGARPGVADEASEVLCRHHPGLTIVGTQHGYFADRQSERVVREINAAEPDLLLVGMGVPHQEVWMCANGPNLTVPLVMGVGGSFDVLAGRVRRAPATWQRLSLEWLWRAMLEPRRLWRARLIPRFMLKVLRDRVKAPLR